MSNYKLVSVHENQQETFGKINVSEEIEVIVSMDTQNATLFFNDVDLEFELNATTGSIINEMIVSDLGTQIYLMQVLQQFEIKPILLNV